MSNNKNCQISSERIDDVVLLLNVMKQIGLPEIINQHLPRHGNEKGLNWGWVGTRNHLAIIYSFSGRPSESQGERVGESKKLHHRNSV